MKNAIRSTALILSTVLGLSAGLIATAHAAEGDMMRLSQRRLADLGYYNGTFDGINGPMTVTALKDFQASNGLPVTGTLTADTYNLLVNLDYRLYNGNAAHYVVNRAWDYQQPVVMHYADGSQAMATRYIPATNVAYYGNGAIYGTNVAYYPNNIVTPTVATYDREGVALNAQYVSTPVVTPVATTAYVGGVIPTTYVSYDDGCYATVNHRAWHYDDCR